MDVHSVPAVVSLTIKLLLLGYAARSRVSNRTTRLFTILLVVLGLWNLSEVAALNYFPRFGLNAMMNAIAYGYFATLIPALTLLLHVSLRLAFAERPNRALPYVLLYVPAVTLEVLLLCTNTVVAGFRPFQFNVLRVPGPWYFLFETYMTTYLLATVVNLALAAGRSSLASIARARIRWWLAAVAPMALLMSYLIVSRHLPVPKLSSTMYVPITQAFFLLVATYATYQYRLFDIEFFVPWSRVRRRKSVFYRRIQETLSEIAALRSVREVLDRLAKTFSCHVALIGGVRPILALANDEPTEAHEPPLVATFPRDALTAIRTITVADEIAHRDPNLYNLMKAHRVAAIIPCASHTGTSGNWFLFSERFSRHVYSPLDFRLVEALLGRIGELFVDGLLLLRAQLADAMDELASYRNRLALAWHQTATLQDELRDMRAELERVRRESWRVFANGSTNGLPADIVSGKTTMQEYLDRWEGDMLRAATHIANGDPDKIGELLGIELRALHYMLQRHKISRDIT